PVRCVGEIVRYEPGHVIVLRDSANKEVSYTLTPSVTVPTGVEVGKRVTLYTTRGTDGSSTVKRVSTSVTPRGNGQRTVEKNPTHGRGGREAGPPLHHPRHRRLVHGDARQHQRHARGQRAADRREDPHQRD